MQSIWALPHPRGVASFGSWVPLMAAAVLPHTPYGTSLPIMPTRLSQSLSGSDGVHGPLAQRASLLSGARPWCPPTPHLLLPVCPALGKVAGCLTSSSFAVAPPLGGVLGVLGVLGRGRGTGGGSSLHICLVSRGCSSCSNPTCLFRLISKATTSGKPSLIPTVLF